MRKIRTHTQKRHIFSLLLVFTLTAPCLSGLNLPSVSDVHAQSIALPQNIAFLPQGETEREGLRFDHVFNTNTQNGGAILQDREGFIWIGTAGAGLMRFDGYDLKIYKPGGINPFPDAEVYDLYEDRDGLIWMITQSSGLVRYDKNTETFKTYTHDPQNPASISSNLGTVLLSKGTIAEDADGQIWVGTQDGLNAFDKHTETFTRYLHDPANPNSLSQNNVYAVVVDRQDRIWVGTNGGGLDRLDKATGTFTHFVSRPGDERSLISNVVYALLEDQDGTLWVGTDKGLHRFNSADGTFTRYLHDPANPNSPNSDVILSLRQNS
jgi:ligand-binding sensor domain-containing protein